MFHWPQMCLEKQNISNDRLLFKCDNMTVVQVVRSERTKDKFLAFYPSNLWYLTAVNDIDIHIIHREGKRYFYLVYYLLGSLPNQ